MGRVLLIEFEDGDNSVFDEIIQALEQHPNNVNNTIGCHVRSLRRKINRVIPDRLLRYGVYGMWGIALK